jgi:HdeA/HdeB family
MRMTRTVGTGISAGLLIAVTLGQAAAQNGKNRSIDQYICKDVMRESGANRDVAIAFLHGFLLGKSGRATFNIDVLHKQTNDFIEQCLDNPGEKAVNVMSKLKK